MMRYEKLSQLSFSILKFRFGEANYYLMRKNPKWNDYNFIGGHVEAMDNGNFERAARRELREEVPKSRGIEIGLVPLTPLIKYGPTHSKSADAVVLYNIVFFCAVFHDEPQEIVENISERSQNRLIEERRMLSKEVNVTNFVSLLNGMLEYGLHSIPLSWPKPLPSISIFKSLPHNKQADFDF